VKRIDYAPFIILVLTVACLLSPLAGCTLDRWAEVEPGTYAVVQSAGRASAAAAREIRKLEIDREARAATFTLVDSSQVAVSFTPRDRSAWPAGCPSNINSTRMEVLEIDQDSLTIGPLTFTDPLLVRDCPPEPERVVLRAGSGPIGGSRTACGDGDECVYFEPGEPSAAPATSPSGAMKGYELYSWPVGQEWHFTLIAGTNRVKTYEEVTGRGSGIDAVLTNGSIEDLLAALDQLPSRAHVIWRGAGALKQIGMEPHDLALPPSPIIDVVAEHAEQADLNLIIVQ
jgi:hypothetical protein